MPKYDAVIFDMDGTLLDTLEDLYFALNHSLNACGYAGRTREEVQSFIGDGVDMLIARAMPDVMRNSAQTNKTAEAEFLNACKCVGEAFREYYIPHGEDHTKPYDGILELLTELRRQGVKTAVVSNKVQEAVERLNERLFAGLIDVAVGDGRGLRLKPEPDMLLFALNELNAKNAVFVGDGDTDIIASLRAGLPCVSVCYGYRDRNFLKRSGGRIFADNAYELAEILGVKI